MQFQWVKKGLDTITKTGGVLLATAISSINFELALVTTDPFTFDFEAVDTDYSYSAAAGLVPQLFSTLTVMGPFVDDATQNVYYKVVGATFTNTSGGAVTITGAAVLGAGETPLEGVLIFDDSEVIADGGTLTLDIPIGVGQPAEDATLENLTPV